MAPCLPIFRECLDNTLRYMVWLLGYSVWSQELYSMALVGPFQLRIFCDSVIPKRMFCAWSGPFKTSLTCILHDSPGHLTDAYCNMQCKLNVQIEVLPEAHEFVVLEEWREESLVLCCRHKKMQLFLLLTVSQHGFYRLTKRQFS